MVQETKQLHSHSGLEREIKFPKHIVLIDEDFCDMFPIREKMVYNKKVYYKVPILDFIRNGGRFKNLME